MTAVVSALGCLIIFFRLVTYGRIALASGIPYVNQMMAHKYLLPNKNATFPPIVQLKFGNSYAQFVNGTLMMGIESLKFVDEDEPKIHGKSFRIAGDKLLIGNETLVPKDGKEVFLVNGVIMKTDGTLTVGPEQRSENSSSCNLERAMCGNHFFGGCCGGLRCKGGVCRKCPPLNEKGILLKCNYDEDCTECFGYGESFCIHKVETESKLCCLATGYICERHEECCPMSYCEHSRCKDTKTCIERAKCTHDSDCCNIHECKNAKCQCKLGRKCDDIFNECCEGERCDLVKGKCACQNGVPCSGEEDCCNTQNCVKHFCTPCVGQNEPCDNNDDCCSEGHCYKGHCRLNFVFSIHVEYQDIYEPHKLPHNCLLENVNDGFGGKFVFLCPQYTSNATDATISFELEVGNCDPGRPNLAEGTGGDCRHLYPKRNPQDAAKIYQIEFSNFMPEDFFYQDTAGDLNQGRAGRDLFLNWHKVYLDPRWDFDYVN